METDAELVWKSAVDLTAMMKTGQVSASEVLDAHLDHIAEVNPKVNAIVTIAAEHGRNMAAEADRRQAAGEELGLLHGCPSHTKIWRIPRASAPPMVPH